MALEKFQQDTVDAAVRALASPAGSRRFLVADEVGLGKTISSKAVAQRLQALRGEPLNVVYMCPNLDIASQNLAKLTTLDDTWDTPPDRLPLAAAMTGKEPVKGFRLFSYTPETSLPGWKGGQRGGKSEERQLIASLVARIAPRFWRKLQALDELRAAAGHNRQFGWNPRAPKHLPSPFRDALLRVLSLAGDDLDAELSSWLKDHDNDIAEFILRARASLALVALASPATRPHFLILDEFHRYADLVLQADGPVPIGVKGERLAVHRMLVDTMLNGNEAFERPALLLMSATPYRLLRLDGNTVETSRYRAFTRLVRFLCGPRGSAEADEAEALIAEHHRSLEARGSRDEAIAAVKAAKLAVEAALRPVMTRTERATTIPGDLFDRRAHSAVVQANDLEVFRHFANSVASKKPSMSGWVTALWSSVPYPAETLFEYKVSSALASLPASTSSAPLVHAAHPQLRALVNADVSGEPVKPAPVDLEFLGLPWTAPTAPWWRLGGPWSQGGTTPHPAGKTLLFSRYVATPLAVSALLSMDLQRRHSATAGAQPFLRLAAKSPWPLIAAFMPWPNLARAIDPLRDPSKRPTDITSAAESELRTWLAGMGIAIARRAGPDRKPWELAFEIEMSLGRNSDIVEALKHARGLDHPRRRAWLKHRASDTTVSRSELRSLAEWLLSVPGMAIARNLLRHDAGLLDERDGLASAFKFCWQDLRPYLGQRAFASAILPRRKSKKRVIYLDAIRKAILAGGFEAVIDEHLAVMGLVGDDTPLEHLASAFAGRSGRVRMRKAGARKAARVTVHAAVPYAGAERSKTKNGANKKLRSDTLRRAFNSPFWPHVLATTSVGQEGLDFHVWCDRIVHWDLPRDPVDFEQREGRISRYASLTVRRSLAATFGDAAQAAPRGKSPFLAILEKARETKAEGIGLERWWAPPGHNPISITFNVRFSQNVSRLHELQQDLTRYRLALGQPEPALFETLIKHFDLKPGEARGLALNLSASNSSSA
jgi:hypothetical protein